MPKAKYENDCDAPLSVAVWLADDDYSFNPDECALSCTDLLKSHRQLVLRQRRLAVMATNPQISVEAIKLSTRVASRMGQSIHAGIEHTWNNNAAEALMKLGYPKRVADKVVINPDPDSDLEDLIPIYMEIRNEREIEGFTISGQFDFCIEGRLEDFKSTSVFTYTNQTNADKYVKQGSIYRWLNPKIVTEDIFNINYIFTDWSKNMARGANYPSQRVMAQTFNLMPVSETESWIRQKLITIKNLESVPEPELPDCTPEELWQKEPKYKYYVDPNKAAAGGRATKNFDDKMSAQLHLSEKGKGTIITVPGEVVACKYCDEFDACTQKDRLIAAGALRME